MSELSKLILEKYQVRKSKKDKDAFIDLLKAHFDVEVFSQGLLKSRNIVVGDLKNAKLILTAHYDTQAVLPIPNFITPLHLPIYLLYQILIVVLVIGIATLGLVLCALLNLPEAVVMGIYYTLILAMMLYIMIGKANKHTANDNTSGVILLVEALLNKDLDVACVFFDHEELGLFGSHAFNKAFKDILKDKLILNFDCISDGDYHLFVYNEKAKTYLSLLKEAFTDGLFYSDKKAFYPSDQSAFKSAAVGVASLNKKAKIYYLDKIHTSKDTVLEEKNVHYFIEGILRLKDLL